MQLARLSVLLLALVLIGCSHTYERTSTDTGPDGENALTLDDPVLREKARAQLYQDINRGLNLFRIAPGDTLEVLFLSSNTPQTAMYVIGVGDRLRIEFNYLEEPARTVVVRPDGRITLPFKGEVMASGRAPIELGKLLEKMYSDVYQDPRVTVSVEEFTSRLDDLRVSLESVQRGRSQKIVVSPEGVVYLPYLEGLRVAGLNIDEARAAINGKYREKFGNLEVSLMLDAFTSRIFVFGEVAKPGMVQTAYQPTVLQVIASVGGHLPTASLANVKVMYWSDEEGQPRLRTVNLWRVIDKLSLEEDMLLPRNTTVYVPPSDITVANRVIDQYLRRLFLFNGTSIGINYELDKNR